MKLYQFPLSPNCQKVVALACEVGVPLELATVDLFKGETRSPEMLAKNPNGKVPILEDGDFVLWESNAMLGYIAAKADRTDLAPTTPRERADVDRWLSWDSAHFGPAIRKVAFERVVRKLGGLGAPDEALVRQGSEEFVVLAKVLDQELSGRDYLCGRLTIADFALATWPHRDHRPLHGEVGACGFLRGGPLADDSGVSTPTTCNAQLRELKGTSLD